MSQTNETREPASNMELLKEEAAACGSGCGCHAGGASGRTRWVAGAVIIVVAGMLVVRAVTKTDDTVMQASSIAFAAPSDAVGALAGELVAVAESEVASATAEADAEGNRTEAKVVCGESIGSLGDLNRLAMDKDGVFIFLAGQDDDSAATAATVVEKAAVTIRGRGIKLGLFTMVESSPEYANLAQQVPPPGVLAMVKGRGASAVTGDITESKLMQAFVAASSGGGCGPSSGGCGPVGCP